MKPRRVLEDVVVPVQVVAPYPATVSQRTCLEWFGITKTSYLRAAKRGAFETHIEGHLRVARFADVEAYLTRGLAPRAKPLPREVRPSDPVEAFDSEAFFRKHGIRKR